MIDRSTVAIDYDLSVKRLESHLHRSRLGHLLNGGNQKILRSILGEVLADNGAARHFSQAQLAYAALTIHIRRHLSLNFFDFLLFATDAMQVRDIHRIVHDFYQYGHDALPKHMKNAGDFIWTPDASVELVLLPRGIGKSVTLMARAVWDLTHEPTDKALIAHGKQELSTGDIATIKSLITNPYLAMVYPEIFKDSVEAYRKSGSILKRNEVEIEVGSFIFDDITDNKGLFKKESTFSAGSINTDETGKHVSRIYFDDLVNEQRSATPEATAEVVSYFAKLAGLKEHEVDKTKRFVRRGAGTQWYENSLYATIMDSTNSAVFSMPIRWEHAKTVYYIASEIFDETIVDQLEKDMGEWSESQYYQIPRKLNTSSLDIGFTESRHIMTVSEAELDAFKRGMLVVQVCDPSYSKANKRAGDGKSRFTILHLLMSKNIIYIFDVFNSLGESNSSIISLNSEEVIAKGVDVFIQDAQGTQLNLYNDVRDIIKKENTAVTCIPHTTSRSSGSLGKLNQANTLLTAYFTDNRIKVVVTDENKNRVAKVIEQLAGRDPGLDIVDCLVYAIDDTDIPTELRRKSARQQGASSARSLYQSNARVNRRPDRVSAQSLYTGS